MATKKKQRHLISPEEFRKMDDNEKVLVHHLNLWERRTSLTGYGSSNPTEQDKKLSDEILQILFDNKDEKFISLSCKYVKHLLGEEKISSSNFWRN